jgi:Spy/CpxP family protein refolding chaperone
MGDTMSDTDARDNLTIDYMRKLHRWRMAFFGVVILLAGMVIGGASMMILVPHVLIKPPPGPEFESEMVLPLLRRDLDLTPEQMDKIKPIMDKYMGKLNQIRMNARTQIGETLKQMNKEIAVILTDEQKRTWQQGLDRLQNELHPRGWHRGQGPGGRRFRGGQPGSERPQFRRGFGPGPGPGPFGPPRFPNAPNFPGSDTYRRSPDTNEPPPQAGS